MREENLEAVREVLETTITDFVGEIVTKYKLPDWLILDLLVDVYTHTFFELSDFESVEYFLAMEKAREAFNEVLDFKIGRRS